MALESKLERLTSLCNQTVLQIYHASPLSSWSCHPSIPVILFETQHPRPLHSPFYQPRFHLLNMHSNTFYPPSRSCPRTAMLTTPHVVPPEPADAQHYPLTTNRPTTSATASQSSTIARPSPTSRSPRSPQSAKSRLRNQRRRKPRSRKTILRCRSERRRV